MIISRTPLRMSFVGGGSDLPVYYQKFGGAVISTAIDKYIYVTVNHKFDDAIRVSYSKTEEVQHTKEIEHQLIRECLNSLRIEGGIEITTVADVPSKGTGLGSSSSFTVGMLHALNAYLGRYVSAETLGKESCKIEIDICKEPIGKQDQYAAAFGGFNLIEFNPDNTVNVNPIISNPQTIKTIENNILMFYTGMTRSASALLQKQSDTVDSSIHKQAMLGRMVKLAYDLRDELQHNNHHSFGEILHENWLLKKSLTEEISNAGIDNWYYLARKSGALGGKILGAGASGFLMLYAPQDAHQDIIFALRHLKRVPVSFERLGSRIIFYDLEERQSNRHSTHFEKASLT